MPVLKRLALSGLILLVLCAVGLYYFNRYWVHRFDSLIAREAAIYRVDPDLVWCIIYEETYFSPWKRGEAGEIGLMQVTPTVAREWAAETGMREFEQQMKSDPASALVVPERNIQIGCWYLEKISKEYRDTPGAEARMIAAYNAGPSRAVEWNKTERDALPLSAEQFIARIDIASTRSYVINILTRYRNLKAEKQKVAGSSQKAEGTAVSNFKSQISNLKFQSSTFEISNLRFESSTSSVNCLPAAFRHPLSSQEVRR